MQDLEKRTTADKEDITFWKRYVNNVFAIVKTEKLNNTTTDNIRFTKEEKDNQLTFPDFPLPKNNDGILTAQVYRENTHIDQVLNYHSNHPTQHKISCIRTLHNRIETHCNTVQSKEKELKYLHDMFIKNNYPTISLANTATQRKSNRRHTRKTSTNPHKKREPPFHTSTAVWKWQPESLANTTYSSPTNRQTRLQRTLPNTKTKLQQRTNATPSTCSTATTVHKATSVKLPKRSKQVWQNTKTPSKDMIQDRSQQTTLTSKGTRLIFQTPKS